jgi:hypothetical protein
MEAVPTLVNKWALQKFPYEDVEAKKMIPRKRITKPILIDSRDRDTSVYASGNHFMVTLPVELTNVKSISLARIFVPQKAPHTYIVMTIDNVMSQSIIQPVEAAQMRASTVGIVSIDTTGGATYRDYSSGEEILPYMSFFNNLGRVRQMEISLWGYGGVGNAPVRYPLANSTAAAENYWAILSVETEMNWT